MDESIAKATRAYRLGDFKACLSILDDVDSTLVNHLDLAYLLGLAHSRLGNWDTALLYLEQVVTGSGEFLRSCQCRLVLAFIYTKTGRNKLAEYELKQLSSSGYESVLVCSGLGFAAWAQGRTDEAIEWYGKALELEAGNANALNGLGYVLASSGRDLVRALEYCRRALASSPDNPAYLDSLGWACFKAGRINEAREHIAAALLRAPGESEILKHARALAGGAASEGTSS
ncbi:MAG: tetratricopeptide repeat protein [Spirochaetota bacterium]